MKLSKESKLRVLENFYAIDYIFFGKQLKESGTCCPAIAEEYLTTKGALMSVFAEMLKTVDHAPKPISEGTKYDSKKLLAISKKAARHARENAEKILNSDKGRKFIKESLKEDLKEKEDVDVKKEAKKKIQESAYKVSIDNLLVARTLQESNDCSKLDEAEGQLIEDSYKILRDGLIESAMLLLDNLDE